MPGSRPEIHSWGGSARLPRLIAAGAISDGGAAPHLVRRRSDCTPSVGKHRRRRTDIMSIVRFGSPVAAGIACAIALATLTPLTALAGEIRYRSFSASAAIGPPPETSAAKLQTVTRTTMGAAGEVQFVKLPGIPPIPARFGGDIVSAVAAGEAGGGFDAAYISGGDLNRAWGFIFNSGVPFGPTFDEFVGFLYGKSIGDGQQTGQELVQELLDLRNRNVIAVPIVGSPEQLSGYFFEPMESVHGHQGI